MLRIRSTTPLYWTSNLLAFSVCSKSSLFILKTRDFLIRDEDLQCGSSRGQGMRLDKIGLAEDFPRITQKYRKSSARLEDFWALVPRAGQQGFMSSTFQGHCGMWSRWDVALHSMLYTMLYNTCYIQCYITY